MPRDNNIPLFLWIATAVLVHLMGAGGADRAALVIEERLDLQRFAAAVRQKLNPNQTFEVALLDLPAEPAPASDPEETAPLPSDIDPPADAQDQQPLERDPESAGLEELTPPRQEDEEKKKREEKEKEDQKLIVLPDTAPPKRIAVRQHVEDQNQEDNPDAEFIADHANRVLEQTQARVTSTDQSDRDPTPGGTFAGPNEEPGDSAESRLGQSEDRFGDSTRTPTDDGRHGERRLALTPPGGSPEGHSEPLQNPGGVERQGQPNAASGAAEPKEARQAMPGQDQFPDTLQGREGAFSVAAERERKRAQEAQQARARKLPAPRREGPAALLGLGAQGRTENGVNLNLQPESAFAAVGRDKLYRERLADSERRRSAHRGSWKASGIERWRSAIENYVPSVKPGNQTALNTARVPFATYLNSIHNRLHPVFAVGFLGSLDSLPSSHPMNREDISTNLEIVVDRHEGRLIRMGVTKTSGVTAFDIGALESVSRAQPFGTPPPEIVSPDGNVYLHWEFWRRPYYACSTYFARPFMLKVRPKSAPPRIEEPPERPFGPEEQPPSQSPRHGKRQERPAMEKETALR